MMFVLRDGVLVPKGSDRDARTPSGRSDFPLPHISRIEPYVSPVSDREITSWRARDRDMAAVGAVDPRDLPPPTRGIASKLKEAERHGRER